MRSYLFHAVSRFVANDFCIWTLKAIFTIWKTKSKARRANQNKSIQTVAPAQFKRSLSPYEHTDIWERKEKSQRCLCENFYFFIFCFAELMILYIYACVKASAGESI